MPTHSEISKRRIELREPTEHHSHPFRVAFAIAVVVGVLLIFVAVGHSRAKHVRENKLAQLEGDWGGLQGCLLGAPLSSGENPSSRFRAVQLGVVGLRHDARNDGKEGPWPARCAPYAADVATHSDAAPAAPFDLHTSMDALGKELRADTSGTADLGKLVDRAWSSAHGANLDAKPGNPASCPRPAKPLLGPDAIAQPSGIPGDLRLADVQVDPSPSDNLRFFVEGAALPNRAVVCSASGAPLTLVCWNVGAEAAAFAPSLALVGTTDPGAHPWVFAGNGGQLGIFRPSGVRVARDEVALGSAVLADDSAWLLLHRPGDGVSNIHLEHVPPTNDYPTTHVSFDAREVAHPSDVTLAWSWVIVRGGPASSYPGHLIAHAMSGAGTLGPALDIGDVSRFDPDDATDAPSRFSLCRGGGNITVRFHGSRGDAMAFYTGAIWTAPVALDLRGGDLLCRGNEATVVSTTAGQSGAPVVSEARCNASGCATSKVALADLLDNTDVMPKGPGSFAAAELDRKLLFVWNGGAVGGLRMRIGSPDEMKTTPDVVLADTKGADESSEVTELRILSAADAGLVLLKTRDGVRIVDVDRAGKASLLHVRI